jgi:YbgC/YbaW family acyl-CoA thioester hydrolase
VSLLTRTLSVRGYEIDRHGVVPAAGFLRYFEHARWEAMGHPDLPMGDFFRDGHRLVVRAQKLEILEPVHFGDTLELLLWVARVGRTSLDLGHEARRAGTTVARCSLVTVHLDPSGNPQPVTDDLRGLVLERPRPQVDLLSVRRPPDVFTLPWSVRPSDLDLLQHVNQARYADYLDDARLLAAEAGAYGPRQSARSATARLAIDYRREARLGDALRIATWPIPLHPLAYGFEIVRSGEEEPIARARVETVAVRE